MLFFLGQKNYDVDVNFSMIKVVSRLCAHYSWGNIQKALEIYLKTKVSINPFMADKAIILLEDKWSNLTFPSKWLVTDDYHLKLEH